MQFTSTTGGTAITTSLGVLTITSDGNYSFRATGQAVINLPEGVVGNVVFTYAPTANGVTGPQQTLTVGVTGANDRPVIVADLDYVIDEDGAPSVSGNVLTNDLDPDGAAMLVVTGAGGASPGASVTGQYGTLVVASNGALTYTLNQASPAVQSLNSGETISETFTYVASDGALSDTAQIRITVRGVTDNTTGPTQLTIGSSSGIVVIAPPAGSQDFGNAIATPVSGGANDVTGDGRADLVIGARGGGTTSSQPGFVFVYSGADLSNSPARTLSNSNGVVQFFGRDVSIGDLNNDGRADVLVGAAGLVDGRDSAGRVYAFFGGGSVNGGVDALNGTNGFTLTNTSPPSEGNQVYGTNADVGPSLGQFVSILGDVNGDGRNDFFVAAPGTNLNGVEDVGDAYIGFGQATYPNMSQTVQSLEAAGKGFQLIGEQVVNGEGYSDAASGQINGTGSVDLVIADARRGIVAVRLGDATPGGNQTDNNDLVGANGIRIVSNEADARFGESIAVGDINNDGRADIIIGAPNASGGAGKVYVLLGQASYASGTVDVAAPPAGVTLIEIAGTGRFGTSVAFVGDFNGDSRGDFVVGAPNDGTNGSAYIITGSPAPSTGVFNIATSSNVIKVTGSDRASLGRDVAGPGDLNGDGLADVALAANDKVFVVYGRSVQVSAGIGKEALALDDAPATLFGGLQPTGAVLIGLPSPIEDALLANQLF